MRRMKNMMRNEIIIQNWIPREAILSSPHIPANTLPSIFTHLPQKILDISGKALLNGVPRGKIRLISIR